MNLKSSKIPNWGSAHFRPFGLISQKFGLKLKVSEILNWESVQFDKTNQFDKTEIKDKSEYFMSGLEGVVQSIELK